MTKPPTKPVDWESLSKSKGGAGVLKALRRLEVLGPTEHTVAELAGYWNAHWTSAPPVLNLLDRMIMTWLDTAPVELMPNVHQHVSTLLDPDRHGGLLAMTHRPHWTEFRTRLQGNQVSISTQMFWVGRIIRDDCSAADHLLGDITPDAWDSMIQEGLTGSISQWAETCGKIEGTGVCRLINQCPAWKTRLLNNSLNIITEHMHSMSTIMVHFNTANPKQPLSKSMMRHMHQSVPSIHMYVFMAMEDHLVPADMKTIVDALRPDPIIMELVPASWIAQADHAAIEEQVSTPTAFVSPRKM